MKSKTLIPRKVPLLIRANDIYEDIEGNFWRVDAVISTRDTIRTKTSSVRVELLAYKNLSDKKSEFTGVMFLPVKDLVLSHIKVIKSLYDAVLMTDPLIHKISYINYKLELSPTYSSSHLIKGYSEKSTVYINSEIIKESKFKEYWEKYFNLETESVTINEHTEVPKLEVF